MSQKLRQYQTESVLLDTTAIGRLVKFFGGALFAFSVLNLLVLGFAHFKHPLLWVVESVIFLFVIGIVLLLKFRQVRWGAALLIWGVSGLVVAYVSQAGLRPVAVIVLPLLIIMAGWVLSIRQAFALTGLALAAFLVVAVGQQLGILVANPPPLPPPLSIWGILATVLLITAYFTFLAQKLYQSRFMEMRRMSNELQLVTEKTPVMLASIDATGVYRYVNQNYADFYNMSPDEMIGQPMGRILDKESYAQVLDVLRRRVRQFEAKQRNLRTGQEVWVQADIMPDITESGKTVGFYAIFRDITDEIVSKQQLDYLAHHDALTGLPNRVLLSDRMSQALVRAQRHKEMVAVCYLDLDGFKPVNDIYGHEMGDKVLIETSQRLQACLRAGDTVARLGGDEFVFLLCAVHEAQEITMILSRVLDSISAPIDLGEQFVSVSGSVGIAVYPDDGEDADNLLRHADQAMFSAKREGKNRFARFDSELEQRARIQHSFVTRALQGLEQGEFLLFFQPKIDMRWQKVVGAEALIRWQHPEKGLLAPGTFLPYLNNTEADIALGNWVLHQAMYQMAIWSQQGLKLPISVNISCHHLQCTEFAHTLAELLAKFPDVEPKQLEIEILESAALDDIERVSQIMHSCVELGVSFALDDFGTGYSSLTYFRRLPASTIKIDASFVRDMLDDRDDLAIVEGVIALAASFGRRVVAEGVETPEHGIPLLHFGCDWAQGYGIARPMPAAAFVLWLQEWEAPPMWEIVTMFNWQKRDFPLLLGDVDLQRWQEHARNCLTTGQTKNLRTMLMHIPRFGLWLDGVGQQYYGHLASFQLTQNRYHALWSEVDALLHRHANNIDALLGELPRLIVASQEVQQIAQALKFQVAYGRVDH